LSEHGEPWVFILCGSQFLSGLGAIYVSQCTHPFRFLHKHSNSQSGQVLIGDWYCSTCRDLNFKSKTTCTGKCIKPYLFVRPDSVPVGKRAHAICTRGHAHANAHMRPRCVHTDTHAHANTHPDANTPTRPTSAATGTRAKGDIVTPGDTRIRRVSSQQTFTSTEANEERRLAALAVRLGHAERQKEEAEAEISKVLARMNPSALPGVATRSGGAR
jgi:hypothetical protein